MTNKIICNAEDLTAIADAVRAQVLAIFMFRL